MGHFPSHFSHNRPMAVAGETRGEREKEGGVVVEGEVSFRSSSFSFSGLKCRWVGMHTYRYPVADGT